MSKRMVPISSIELLDEIYPRSHTDFRTVHTYAEAILQGATFPPIDAVLQDGVYFVLDGWHRFRAWKQVGMEKVPVKVVDVPRAEWYRYALETNIANGRPLTQQDKVTAILRLRRMKTSDMDISEVLKMTVDHIHHLIATKAAITNPDTGNGLALKPALAEVKDRIERSPPIDLEAIQRKLSGQRQFNMIAQVNSLFKNNWINEEDVRVVNAIAELKAHLDKYLK